jgi:hypothetical protein
MDSDNENVRDTDYVEDDSSLEEFLNGFLNFI